MFKNDVPHLLVGNLISLFEQDHLHNSFYIYFKFFAFDRCLLYVPVFKFIYLFWGIFVFYRYKNVFKSSY